MSRLEVRAGDGADEPLLLELFDQAVAWMVARGQEGQWGSEPPSTQADWRARIHGLATGEGLYVAELDGRGVGALAVGEHPDYVPAADVPELYVILLLTARTHSGMGLGARLLDRAEAIARERGVAQLRVDCWADAPTLPGYYEGQGFEPCGSFQSRAWRGRILRRPVPYQPAVSDTCS